MKKYISENNKILSSKITSVSSGKTKEINKRNWQNIRIDLIMEVILLENIIKLGNIGDKVNVKPGYGRNFLLKLVKLCVSIKKIKTMFLKKKKMN